ncbi:MAG TPA: acyltransferase family protein [Lapillicoccus sp.]|nr:acyltransferase family protein [Lapillicoccus sp.]
MSTLERLAPDTTADRGSRAAGHLDGLDGLRALAIVAVVVYHLDPAWLPGGFLGVDVFFVVSGFLITTLLQREAVAYGRIRFGRFWTRRARRLIPALVVCVVVSTVAARVAHHDLVVHIGRQLLGALTFSTNWVEIAAGSSYFDQTAPQLFMNFWSLAVEEQFYLFWPLVVAALMTTALLPRGRRAAGLGITLGVAALSTALMALLYVPGEDATRVYYGTDTHLMGLMLGAALAFAWSSSWWTRYAPGWLAARRPALGAALLTLAALLLVLREDSPLTYRGGLALACLATVVLVAALLSDSESRWRGLLSAEPVAWVGRRSYGIYLWHWPVIVILGQDMRTAPGTFQHVVSAIWCVIVTIALADLSYRFVEAPVRVWGFRECGRMAWGAVRFSPSWAPRLAAGVSVALVAACLVVVATAPGRSDTEEAIADTAVPAATVPTPVPSATTTAPTGPPQDWSMPTGDQIDVFGDSLIATTKGAIDYYFPGVRQDAKSNRRWSDGLAAVAARGQDVRRAVVLAFGTNAGVTEETVVQTLDRLGPDRMVVLVNLYNPRSTWIDESNATLARVASTRPNVVVADWNAAITTNLGLLQSDKVHPGISGAHLFAKTVRAAMAELSTRHTGQTVVLKDLKAP